MKTSPGKKKSCPVFLIAFLIVLGTIFNPLKGHAETSSSSFLKIDLTRSDLATASINTRPVSAWTLEPDPDPELTVDFGEVPMGWDSTRPALPTRTILVTNRSQSLVVLTPDQTWIGVDATPNYLFPGESREVGIVISPSGLSSNADLSAHTYSGHIYLVNAFTGKREQAYGVTMNIVGDCRLADLYGHIMTGVILDKTYVYAGEPVNVAGGAVVAQCNRQFGVTEWRWLFTDPYTGYVFYQSDAISGPTPPPISFVFENASQTVRRRPGWKALER